MREFLAVAPDWSQYAPGAQPSIDIKKYYISETLGGGHITGYFAIRSWGGRVRKIEAPLDDLLGMETSYGLYDIKKV